MSVTEHVTQQFYLDDIRWKSGWNPFLDCATKIFLSLFKQLWCLTKNVPIERIENGAIFTKGQGDTQFSINVNMQIRSTEISYKSGSQNLAFRSTYLRSFEGQNSLRKYYFVLGINRALLSIFRVSSPSGKGASYEPPTPLGNFLPLNPPPPRNFPWPSVGGGYGYFLEPHNTFTWIYSYNVNHWSVFCLRQQLFIRLN